MVALIAGFVGAGLGMLLNGAIFPDEERIGWCTWDISGVVIGVFLVPFVAYKMNGDATPPGKG